MSNEILEKYNQLQRPINVVGFASGGGLGEVRILVETLIKNPQAKINLTLIDSANSTYAFTKSFLELPSAVDSSQHVTLSDLLKDKSINMNSFVTQMKNFFEKEDDKKIETNARLNWVSCQIRHQELVNWIHCTFPQATFNLHVFGDHEEYIYRLEQDLLECPDIIQGADFFDEVSLVNKSSLHYDILIAYALIKTKSKCSNLCLRNYYNDDIRITSLHLEHDKKSDHETFFDTITSTYAHSYPQRFSKIQQYQMPIMNYEEFVTLLQSILKREQKVLQHNDSLKIKKMKRQA